MELLIKTVVALGVEWWPKVQLGSRKCTGCYGFTSSVASPEEAEGMALRESLLAAKKNKWHSVIIETDAEVAHNALKKMLKEAPRD